MGPTLSENCKGMSKVSVVIPAYNAEDSIGRAIASVLSQEYDCEYEILVIDDRSDDNTAAVVRGLSSLHPEIQCISNERQKGPSGARNTGLLRATGEYTAFLDADDVWRPNHLLEGIGFLDRSPDVDVVFFNFDVIYGDSDEHPSTDWFSLRDAPNKLRYSTRYGGFKIIEDDLFDALINESFIHLQSMIVRRRSIGNILFNEKVRRSEDRDFCLRLSKDSHAVFAFKNQITSAYFRYENSLTSLTPENHLATLLDHIALFSDYLQLPELDASRAKKLKYIIAKRLMAASYAYRTMNMHGRATKALFKSCRYKLRFRQAVEFLKIIISFVSYSFRRT